MSTLATYNLKHPDAAGNQITFTSGGNTGIGTASPATRLHVADGAGILVQDTGGTERTTQLLQSGNSFFIDVRDDANNGQLVIRGKGGGSASEYARFDTSGRLLVGSSSFTGEASVVIEGSSAGGNTQAQLWLNRGQTDPVIDNVLGQIIFGDATASGSNGAMIQARADGNWGGSNGNPSRLAFFTESAGSDDGPSEQMTIKSTGEIYLTRSASTNYFRLGSTNRFANGNNTMISYYHGYNTPQMVAAINCNTTSNSPGLWGAGDLAFYTGNSGGNDAGGALTHRLNISYNGNIDVKQNQAVFRIFSQNGFNIPMIARNTGNNINQTMIEFRGWNDSVTGGISTRVNVTTYATSSDYRLKENVAILEGGIDRVKQLQPKTFNFIDAPETRLDGFFAHEVQEIVPEAVTGVKDGVEEIGTVTDENGVVLHEEVPDYNGKPEGQTWTATGTRMITQGIDQSKLVPLLTCALKEAIAKIEALEQRLDDAGIA